MISFQQRQILNRTLQRKIAERNKTERQLESLNTEIRSIQTQLEQGQ